MRTFILTAIVVSNAQDCTLPSTRTIQADEIQYLTGYPYVAGSIYAVCGRNGQLECFRDDGIADETKASASKVDCPSGGRKLGVVPNDVRLWPANTMCYQIQDAYTSEQLDLLQESIAEFNNRTSIRIISTSECASLPERASICGGSCQHFAVIRKNGNDCMSTIGYARAPGQKLDLSDNCFTKGLIIHELAHSLGLYHEQQHPNRNVIVLRDVVARTGLSASNYQIISRQKVVDFPYDPLSIMHYRLDQGLCLPKPEYQTLKFCDINQSSWTDNCIVPEPKHCDQTAGSMGIGQRNALSAGDLATLMSLYPKQQVPVVQKIRTRLRSPKVEFNHKKCS